MSNIGLMEGAFFVGRKEILDWLNSQLDLNLQKVEETASGAVACQLLDIMYPNTVPMSKVNWAAKQSFEFVANYKILQTCFAKLNIERHIDVDRLIGGKYMDNLEFMQWFKRFYEMSVSDKGDYDAYAQRCKGKGGATYGGGKSGASSAAASKPASAPAAKPTHTKAPAASSNLSVASKGAPKASAAAAPAPAAARASEQENDAQANNRSTSADAQKEIAALRQASQEAARQYAELRSEMEGLEKERDFYFEKLRDIEIVLQDVEDRGEGNETTASIFKILYATADGFEPSPGVEGPTKSVDVYPENSSYDEAQESY